MDSPFVFSKEVINESFIGRKDELSWLASNLSKKENTILVAPPGYGKRSLVRNAFIQASKQTALKLCVCNLFNIRDEYAFYTLLSRELFGTVCSTGDEWIALADQLLPLTRPQVEINERKPNELRITFDKQRLLEYADEVLQLPEKIAALRGVSIIVWINDFQEIAAFEHTETFQKRLADQWKNHKETGYLLSGSKINAMHALMAEKQAFHKFGEQIPLEPVDGRLFTDYIIRSFSKSGRVIAKDCAEIICQTAHNYPFYVQQFAHLCWLNTKGFATETLIKSTLEDLFNYNERLFRFITDNLSTYQVNYIHAIIDGMNHFSAADVITCYQLNSSANITRVRGALEKKEVLFCTQKQPAFIDPVFELWLRKRFFDA